MDVINKIDRLLETTVTADVEKNYAKGEVPLLGMRYRKKKKKSKLTGVDITTHEEREKKKTRVDIKKILKDPKKKMIDRAVKSSRFFK